MKMLLLKDSLKKSNMRVSQRTVSSARNLGIIWWTVEFFERKRTTEIGETDKKEKSMNDDGVPVEFKKKKMKSKDKKNRKNTND